MPITSPCRRARSVKTACALRHDHRRLSSVGKSHLMRTPLAPQDLPRRMLIEVITSGSPKSLVFMVRDDPHALSHKMILLGETAGYIAGSDTDSNPSAALVRDVLTEGVITYGISEKDDKGQFVTQRIKVWGPISLITTTAWRTSTRRWKTGCLKSFVLTRASRPRAAIRHAQLSGETRRRAEAAAPEVEKLIDFQRWLQLEEGVRVVIPDDLLESIDAVGGIPVTVQTRRDVPLFKLRDPDVRRDPPRTAQADRRGRGDRGIRGLRSRARRHRRVRRHGGEAYSTSLKPPEIAVLAAIEALIVEDQKRRKGAAKAAAGKPETGVFDGFSITDMKARFTYDALAAQAQIKSRQTLSKRVKVLKRAKAIEVIVEHSGYGTKSSPLSWELLISPRLAQAATAAKYGRFMPRSHERLRTAHRPRHSFRSNWTRSLPRTERLPDWRTDDDAAAVKRMPTAPGTAPER